MPPKTLVRNWIKKELTYHSPANWENAFSWATDKPSYRIPRHEGSHRRSIIDPDESGSGGGEEEREKNRGRRDASRRVASRHVASRMELRQIWILTLSYSLVSALPRASRIEYDAHLYNPSLHSFPFLLPRPVHSHARASAHVSHLRRPVRGGRWEGGGREEAFLSRSRFLSLLPSPRPVALSHSFSISRERLSRSKKSQGPGTR